MLKLQKRKIRPEQKQNRPGSEKKLAPLADTKPREFEVRGKLSGKVCLITGGDSGIGKAVSLLFAKEGADLAIAYLSETEDALQTKKEIEETGQKCILIKGDLAKEKNRQKVITTTFKKFEQLDIVINNVALHWESDSIEKISTEQLMKTFHANFFSY